MEEETECVACMDKSPEVRYRPCGHLAVCVECHFKGHPLKTQEAATCPLCRAKVTTMVLEHGRRYEDVRKALRSAFARDPDVKHTLYTCCKIAISHGKDARKVTRAISSFFRENCNGSLPTMMSVDLVEILLRLVSEKLGASEDAYMLHNLLVALCREPWSVDINLGGCGLCYFGNFGEEPIGLHRAASILRDNLGVLGNACHTSYWTV